MSETSQTSQAQIEKELLALERQYWRAMQEGDGETAAQGVGKLDRATLAGMLKGGSWKLTSFELSSPVVLSITDDVAVVAYKVHEELTVDGKALAFDAADSSTWVKRGGSWVCAAHTEAIAGDPFGRDRSKKK
jgi:Domain of unknown function (DUF4440)